MISSMKHLSDLKPPIFIGGLMKSGTTLLRRLLSQHPHIYGGLETHWFNYFHFNSFNDWESSTLSSFYSLDASTFQRLSSIAKNDNVPFVSTLLSYKTLLNHKLRWVEKTPDNLLNIQKIFEYWPNSILIHVVRDYRDIFASWKLSSKGSIDDFLEKALLVRHAVKPYSSDTRVLVLRYEDLVVDTTCVMTTLLSALNETADSQCMGINTVISDQEYHLVYDKTGKVSNTLVSMKNPISPSKIGAYRSILSQQEIFKIEAILRYEINKYSYCS